MTVDEAIEQLYRSMDPYRRRTAIDICPHCAAKSPGAQTEHDTLPHVPLRELSCEQLSRYAVKAVTLWGGPKDYKHFLPRIVELITTPEASAWPGMDIQQVAIKLVRAQWTTWPASEQKAVRDVLTALWIDVLAHDPEQGPAAYEVLQGIAYAVTDLSAFLELWAADESLPSLLQLGAFYAVSANDLTKHGHLQDLWTDIPSRDDLERWLFDRAREAVLVKALEDHRDGPAAERLAAALDAWRKLCPLASHEP